MTRWDHIALGLCCALVAGFLLGRATVSAAEPHEVAVYGLAKQAVVENGVDPPIPTPTQTEVPKPTVVPPTATTQPIVAVHSGCPAVIIEVFGPTAPAACEVAWCESSYNPNATGAANERGYFQVHPIHGYPGWTHDPVANTQYAYQLSNGGRDWSHWSCKP